MNENESKGRGHRRVLLIATPFAVGAAAGAALFAGLGSSSTADPTAASAVTHAASSANVAATTSQFDAETIYKRDSPGVVDITVTQSASQDEGQGLSPFAPGGGSQQAQAEGTGYVYDKSGNIITADHVVSGATKISVRFKRRLDGDGDARRRGPVDRHRRDQGLRLRRAELTPLVLADSSTVAAG